MRSIARLFFFNYAATTEIYTLSLHDALPICNAGRAGPARRIRPRRPLVRGGGRHRTRDRKSTRLNSSHANISYAVFCLKKKKDVIRGGHKVSVEKPHASRRREEERKAKTDAA